MIIIFTIKYDISTSNVIKWLQFHNQEVIRINGDDTTYKLISIDETEILFKNLITGKVYNLLNAKSCWWRRNGISASTFYERKIKENLIINDLDLSSLIKGNGSILAEECEHLKDYIYERIFEKCEINLGRPLFNLNKLKILDYAKTYGLKIPKYKIVTNTMQLDNNYESVTKAISNGIYKIIKNHSYYSYTEKLNVEELQNNITSIFPTLQMELINKKIEIRTFFIENNFFSMAIFSQATDQTKIDFRKYNNKFPSKTEPFVLPKEIENKLKQIFKKIELNCGSADIIIDENGNFIFLEINPVGQYGMVSDPCNYDLDNRIAKYLINGTFENN